MAETDDAPTRTLAGVLTGIDHLVIAVSDPDAAAADLAAQLEIEAGTDRIDERRGGAADSDSP